MLGRLLHSPLAAPEARAVPESDDEELLAGLQRRDPHSIAKLYDLYGSQLYRLILVRVESPYIAEDLVVQTFLLAWNRAGQRSSQPTTLFRWLKSLATTCAADYVRECGAMKRYL
jgi:DNA-directed RNA polymerase specialized sigma24 family protein